MVLTHPDYRKRGFARCLVEAALKLAEANSIRSVKLDATDHGLPLYESLGFKEEQWIERWSGMGHDMQSLHSLARAGAPEFDLDREAFGADRSPLLELLTVNAPPFRAEDGFAMWRPGVHASFIGPCVARSPESAKVLIASCLSANSQKWFWDLFPSNGEAVRLAQGFGFVVVRTLTRMVWGQNMRGNESMIYAGAGFELG
jgi:hypothetical protein